MAGVQRHKAVDMKAALRTTNRIYGDAHLLIYAGHAAGQDGRCASPNWPWLMATVASRACHCLLKAVRLAVHMAGWSLSSEFPMMAV
jgi:hypothetical protein